MCPHARTAAFMAFVLGQVDLLHLMSDGTQEQRLELVGVAKGAPALFAAFQRRQGASRAEMRSGSCSPAVDPRFAGVLLPEGAESDQQDGRHAHR